MNRIPLEFRGKVISMTTVVFAACSIFLAVPLVSVAASPAESGYTAAAAVAEPASESVSDSRGENGGDTEVNGENSGDTREMQSGADGSEGAEATAAVSPDVQKFGLVAAAIAFGFGAIGAGIAIANVGAAAMGAIGEKPEIASQALIFIALAEGLVVFGFITALMILGKV